MAISDQPFGICAARPGVKPLLLQKMESILENELLSEENQPREKRVRIISEVFDLFLNGFGIYKNVLSRIKSEYELVFQECIQHMRCIPALKSRLTTIKEEAETKISSIKLIHQQEKASLVQSLNGHVKARECDSATISGLRAETESLNDTVRDLQLQVQDYVKSKHTLSNALKRYKSMFVSASSERQNMSQLIDDANHAASESRRANEATISQLAQVEIQRDDLRRQINTLLASPNTNSCATNAEIQLKLMETEFSKLLDLYGKATRDRAQISLQSTINNISPSSTSPACGEVSIEETRLFLKHITLDCDKIGSDMPLDDLIRSKLHARFSTDMEANQWINGLYACIRRHQRFRIFHEIIEHRFPIRVYLDFCQDAFYVIQALHKISSDVDGSASLSFKDLSDFIDEYFGTKLAEPQRIILKYSMSCDTYPDGRLNVENDSDVDPFQLYPHFIECLAHIYIENIYIFTHEILSRLKLEAQITAPVVMNSILSIDPQTTHESILDKTRLLMGIGTDDEIAADLIISYGDLVKRAGALLLKPCGPMSLGEGKRTSDCKKNYSMWCRTIIPSAHNPA